MNNEDFIYILLCIIEYNTLDYNDYIKWKEEEKVKE